VGFRGIRGGLKPPATLSIPAPAVVMVLPMFDVLLAVIRRKLTGRRFDAADRQHIHHRLLDRGLTPWQVLCILGALCLLTGAAATTASLLRNDTIAWVTTVTLLVLAIRLRLFGHYEFSLLKRALVRGVALLTGRTVSPGRRVPTAIELRPLGFEAIWALLIDEVQTWKVRRLELTVYRHGEPARQHQWTAPSPTRSECSWTVAVSFPRSGGQSCELRAAVDGAYRPRPRQLTGLTRLLRTFGKRLAHVEPQRRFTIVRAMDEDRPRAFASRRKAA
jgi:UDP-GlcNAc:undecaprenyl-phosphate/decaprenyl-phosphate GlcNAc-1-phosphate transferase